MTNIVCPFCDHPIKMPNVNLASWLPKCVSCGRKLTVKLTRRGGIIYIDLPLKFVPTLREKVEDITTSLFQYGWTGTQREIIKIIHSELRAFAGEVRVKEIEVNLFPERKDQKVESMRVGYAIAKQQSDRLIAQALKKRGVGK